MTKTAILLFVAFSLAACSDEGKNLSGADKAAAPTSAPAANPHGAQPDPHAGAPNPHAGMKMPMPAAPTAEAPVAWTVPQGWAGGPSGRPMRAAEFDVGKDDSGAAVQCVVYSGIGGSDEENLSRWTTQMGDAAKAAAKTTHADHDGLKITRFETRGVYTDTMRAGPAKTVDDATMLAAIVEGPNGKLHVKLVGPSSVVAAAAANFDAFLASMKPK